MIFFQIPLHTDNQFTMAPGRKLKSLTPQKISAMIDDNNNSGSEEPPAEPKTSRVKVRHHSVKSVSQLSQSVISQSVK